MPRRNLKIGRKSGMQRFKKEHERSEKKKTPKLKRNTLQPSFKRVKAKHKIPRQTAKCLSIFKIPNCMLKKADVRTDVCV